MNKNEVKDLKVLKHVLKLAINDDKKTDASNKIINFETDNHSNSVLGIENFSINYSDVKNYLKKSSDYSSLDEMLANDNKALYPLGIKIIFNYNNTQVADENQDDVIWDSTLTHQDLLDRVNKVLSSSKVAPK